MSLLQLHQLGNGKVGKAFVKALQEHVRQHPERQLANWIIETSSSSISQKSTAQTPTDSIFLDLTASIDTGPKLLAAAQAGSKLILANKNPLVLPQKTFDQLMTYPIGFRATVGAGLPVIPEINSLRSAGMAIIKMEACLSGTLGILCTELEKGRSFSSILREAYALGFTEPDPRIDLAGGDVARKILIIGRYAGQKMDLEQVLTEALFPPAMKALSIPDFLKQLDFLDPLIQTRVDLANAAHKVLRYVARFENNIIQVGLEAVDRDSPLGQLKTDGKRILLKTNTGEQITITGAGSGPSDTAKDLIQDLLDLTQQ